MLANSITEFNYDPETGHTFEAWFIRWEDVFRTDLTCQDDTWKVRLLVRKLGTKEHSRCVKIVKRDGEDYGMLADRVNRDCERFKLRSLTDDQFKLDQDPDMNLKSLMAEFKRLLSVKQDTVLAEQKTFTADVNCYD
ncbi:unnamed protein product [Echinostoma caproni]|uniref:ADF-H domain-containing protein n=1 Tax=Echinostoma caproni TaxID=27848 RepID=A0A183A0Q1_9TREM|nr:unnamed protein product [Echinostoma caproni]